MAIQCLPQSVFRRGDFATLPILLIFANMPHVPDLPNFLIKVRRPTKVPAFGPQTRAIFPKERVQSGL